MRRWAGLFIARATWCITGTPDEERGPDDAGPPFLSWSALRSLGVGIASGVGSVVELGAPVRHGPGASLGSSRAAVRRAVLDEEHGVGLVVAGGRPARPRVPVELDAGRALLLVDEGVVIRQVAGHRVHGDQAELVVAVDAG